MGTFPFLFTHPTVISVFTSQTWTQHLTHWLGFIYLALFTFHCLLCPSGLCFDCMSQKQSHYLPVSISTQLKHSLWFFSFSSNSCYVTDSAPRNSMKFDLTASLSPGCIPIMSSRKICRQVRELLTGDVWLHSLVLITACKWERDTLFRWPSNNKNM